MQKKTIQITPELFHIGKEKTRKNREKQKPIIPPVVNPNSIKKQLLNKIKQHKEQERASKLQKPISVVGPNDHDKADISDVNFTDEFRDSIEYLSSLSKKQKETAPAPRASPNPSSKSSLLMKPLEHNKTLKHPSYHSSSFSPGNDRSESVSSHSIPHVELDLPEELSETFINSKAEPSEIKMNYVSTATTDTNNSVPYGCLKNGKKPTYRMWKQNQTRKNYEHESCQEKISSFQPAVQIETPSISVPTFSNVAQSYLPEVSDRERKLEILRKKIKEREEEKAQKQLFDKPMIQISKPKIHPNLQPQPQLQTQPLDFSKNKEKPNVAVTDLTEMVEIPSVVKIKKTIRRKYKLGKSSKYRKVGILVKDNTTRKRIIDAQKELKKKPITEIKKYLKDRGLLKVGSNAPNDVLRKTFETAMLAGEIVNVNRETILHNLLNEVH